MAGKSKGAGRPRGSDKKTQRLMVEALLRRGPQTPTELATETGLARSTIVRAGKQLPAKGLLEVGDEYAIGRRGWVLAVAASREHMRCAVVDPHGRMLAQADAPTMVAPLHTDPLLPDEAAEALADLARRCQTELDDALPEVVCVAWPAAISRSAGGLADFEKRHDMWLDVRLLDVVSDGLEKAGHEPREIVLMNDADAEFLAESVFGVARGERIVLGVKAAGGIGSALVVDGVVHEGLDRSVGEIGHAPVVIDGVEKTPPADLLGLNDLNPCSCGAATHLERYASGRAIMQRLLSESELSDGYDPAAKRLFAESDERRLRSVFFPAGKIIGRALVAPWLLLEPDLVVVRVFPHHEATVDGVTSELSEAVGRHAEVKLGTPPEEGGDWMAARGAARYAFERKLKPALV